MITNIFYVCCVNSVGILCVDEDNNTVLQSIATETLPSLLDEGIIEYIYIFHLPFCKYIKAIVEGMNLETKSN